MNFAQFLAPHRTDLPSVQVATAPGQPIKPTIARRIRDTLSFAYLAGLGRPKQAKTAPAAVRVASGTAKPTSPATPPLARATTKPAQVKRPASPRPDPDAELWNGPAEVIDARSRERARCAAIIGSPAGQAHPAMARALAFTTRTTEAEALELLAAQPASATRYVMRQRLPTPEAVASSLDRAFARAGAG